MLTPAFFQCALNVLQRLHGLGVNVTRADDLSIRPGSRGARHMYVRANFYGTRVTNNGLPRCAAGKVLPLRILLLLHFDSSMAGHFSKEKGAFRLELAAVVFDCQQATAKSAGISFSIHLGSNGNCAQLANHSSTSN
jgi:hypothetical protein